MKNLLVFHVLFFFSINLYCQVCDPVCPTGEFCYNGECLLVCAPGQFSSLENGCSDCPEGTVQSQHSATSCIPCAAGRYQDEKGKTECKACPPGTYGDELRLATCKPCEEGEYQDSQAQTSCKICPDGYISPKGSTSLSDCILSNPAGSTEITGKLTVGSMLKTNYAEDLVIRRPDGSFGYREATSIEDGDSDSSNEIQAISIMSDSLYLSKGGSQVALSDLIIKYFIKLPNGITTLLAAGESLENLLNAGAKIQDLINQGSTIQDLIDIGVSIQDLIDAETPFQDLVDAGVSVQDLVDAGVSVQDLLNAFGGIVQSIKLGLNPLLIINDLNVTVDSLLKLDFCDISAPLQLAQSGLSLDSLYGKLFQEGVIFYVDTANLISGGDALVAALSNQAGTSLWGCYNISVNNTMGTTIGTGLSNTNSIMNNGCESNNGTGAAGICAGYDSGIYDDWFLPSKDELNEMKNNLHLKGHNNFLAEGGGDYWSSSQIDNLNAWSLPFDILSIDSEGGARSQGKQFGWRVRAARIVLRPSCIN